jgi:hypothetical protein
VSRERRLGRGLEALLGRAGMEATPAPAAHGSAAVASAPAGSAGMSAAARLILHKPEEIEQAAASLPANEILEGLIDANPYQPRSQVHDWPTASASMGSCSRSWCGRRESGMN